MSSFVSSHLKTLREAEGERERENLKFNIGIETRMPECLYTSSDDNQKLVSSPRSEISLQWRKVSSLCSEINILSLNKMNRTVNRNSK